MKKTITFSYDNDPMDVLNLLSLIAYNLKDFNLDLTILEGGDGYEEFIIETKNENENED
jgi:hypothetical protein